MDYKRFLKEITCILNNENKKTTIEECLQQILPFTGSEENKSIIFGLHDLIEMLIAFTSPTTYDSNMKYLTDILINLCAEEHDANKILQVEYRSCDKGTKQSHIIYNCFKQILNPESELADNYCKLICNLSRTSQLINHIIDHVAEHYIIQLLDAFCNMEHNKKGCNLDYLAPFMANVAQTSIGVTYLFPHLSLLLQFIKHNHSFTRRYGIVAMIKNITMKYTTHESILNKNSNILPNLLVLLVDTESKVELINYIPDLFQPILLNSVKETDNEIRLILLEILLKLCNSPEGREFMRGQGVYEILRELHKSENDPKCIYICETVVNILLRTEDEIGATNLNELLIPPEIETDMEKNEY